MQKNIDRKSIEILLREWRNSLAVHNKLAQDGDKNSRCYADMLRACIRDLENVLIADKEKQNADLKEKLSVALESLADFTSFV